MSDTDTPSPTPDVKAPVVRQGDVWPLLYFGTRGLLRWLYTLNGGVQVEGRENVPKKGAAIIAPNHASHTDPPLIAIANRRPVTIMAKEELFSIPFIGPYIDHLGMFAVKRGVADRAALRLALERLAQGRLLVIFPEGTRGDGITLQEPERGLGLMAMKSGVPVIPAFIYGTNKMMPRGDSKIHRAKVGVVYGKAIMPSDFSGKRAGDELAAAVMQAIEALRR
jgi:1-acyl-sn-glycerol-3-phosphate acyltransferase